MARMAISSKGASKTSTNRTASKRRITHRKDSSQKIHVIPQNKKWAIKKEGSARASKISSNKETAISQARKMAKQDHKDVVVHRKDGTIEKWHKN